MGEELNSDSRQTQRFFKSSRDRRPSNIAGILEGLYILKQDDKNLLIFESLQEILEKERMG
ncbi:hypothetical protein NC651_037919 [Populus alba x Populus x berolinensis]|nr:hypothetical protein NC651_037919 [Populus alba x Populus x berolinensis]